MERSSEKVISCRRITLRLNSTRFLFLIIFELLKEADDLLLYLKGKQT